VRLIVTHAVVPPHSAKLQGKARAGMLAMARSESVRGLPRRRAACSKSDGSNKLKPCNLKPYASPLIALPVPGGPAFRGGMETAARRLAET
jgi:hypothetical protein